MYNKTINHTYIDPTTGYIYFIDKYHPMATTNGKVALHRHIYSMYLGRWLTGEEIIHHIDKDKLNNTINNLEVLSSSEHAKLHAKERGFNLTKEMACPVCYNTFMQTATAQIYCCMKCSSNSQVKNKSITKKLLDELIPLYTWRSLGALLDYSDVGIKKRAKSLGCDISKIGQYKKMDRV